MMSQSFKHDPLVLAVALFGFGFVYAPLAWDIASFIVYRLWSVK